MNETQAAKTGTWIAEDVPMYMIDNRENKPRRDEDVTMSAPISLGKHLSYTGALIKVAEHLESIAKLRITGREKTETFYRTAAQLFLAADETVGSYYPLTFGLQIHGRFYRVRNVTS